MIQMIAGVFGLQVNGVVKAMDKNSGPFEASPEQEARLIRLGLAVHVDDGAPIGFDETPPEADEDDGEIDEFEHDVEPEEVVEEVNLEDMSAKELREIGQEYGLTFKGNASKSAMIDAIKSAQAEGEDDGEPEPAFDASEAVM